MNICVHKRTFKIRIKEIIFVALCICQFSCNKNIIEQQPTLRVDDITLPVTTALNSVYFVNIKTGFIAGNMGQILKTKDGANTWENISIEKKIKINTIRFSNDNDGFIGTSTGIMKTADGGKTWVSVLSGCNINALFNENISSNVYAAGNIGIMGTIWESSDLGMTWSALKLPISPKSPPILHAIQFLDKDTAYAGGNESCLLQTVNGGKTWTYCQSLKTENITDFHFTNFGHGYITFDTGKLFEMTKNGRGITINASIQYPIHSIAYLNETGIAVGKNCIYKNEAGFDSERGLWSYMLSSSGVSFQKTYYDICFADGSIAYAVGENGTLSRLYIEN